MYHLQYIFFFKQKTAYELRISDWSSDVCSSDLLVPVVGSIMALSLPYRSRMDEIPRAGAVAALNAEPPACAPTSVPTRSAIGLSIGSAISWPVAAPTAAA